jgi:chromosome segregation ATPase
MVKLFALFTAALFLPAFILAGCVETGGSIFDNEVYASKRETIKNSIRTNQQILALLRTKMSEIAAEIIDAQKQIEELKSYKDERLTRVRALDARVRQLEGEIAILSNKQAEFDAGIKKAHDSIADAQAKSKEISDKAAKITAANQALASQLQAAAADKAAKEKNLGIIQAEAADAAAKLAAEQAKLQELAKNLSIISANKAQIEKQIAENQKAISALLDKIKNDQDRISRLKGDAEASSPRRPKTPEIPADKTDKGETPAPPVEHGTIAPTPSAGENSSSTVPATPLPIKPPAGEK